MCEVASWLPPAAPGTPPPAAPVLAWLAVLRASPEEYDPLLALQPPEQPPDPPAPSPSASPDSAFDEILSQLGKEIYKLDEYHRHLIPGEKEEVSLSFLSIFDQCLGEFDVVTQCYDLVSNSEVHVHQPTVISNAEEQTVTVNGRTNGHNMECSDCDSTLSDVSFVTSTPAKENAPLNMESQVKPVPLPRTRLKTPSSSSSFYDTMDVKPEQVTVASDSDSESTCWSYQECSTDENDNNKDQYAVVWSHSSGFHNSDEILRKVLTQNLATVTDIPYDTTADLVHDYSVYALSEVGDRCGDAGAPVAMTAARAPDDGYEPVRDALTDENIYEEIEYGYSYTDEGCSCGGSIEVESCSMSASSEGVGRDSPLYANLRDHDAYAVPSDVIAWKNSLLDPFYNDDEEDEWITPEECAVYSREQRPPLVIPRITQYRGQRPPPHVAHSYPEETFQEPLKVSSVRQYDRLPEWSADRYDVEYSKSSESPRAIRMLARNRLAGSTENLLLRRPNQLQLPASSSGDSLDIEVRDKDAQARSRKSKSMVAPKHRVRSPVPAPRMHVPAPPVDSGTFQASVVQEGFVKRTKFSESGKKSKKNWTECYMLLTQTGLVFFKDQKTYYATKAPRPAGSPPSPAAPRAELVLPLRNAHVVPCIQMHTRRHSRSLVLTVGYDQYLLQDETEDGARRWLARIQSIIYKLGPPLSEDYPTPQSQSSNTDIESIGRTPPPAPRHPHRAKQKAGGSSNEDLSDEKTHVKSRLKKFFARRPTMEVLVKKGIYKDEPVFGRNLEEVCLPSSSPRVPEFVVHCVEEIEGSEENMTTDGLYRASGNLSQVQKIRLEIDQNNLAVIKNNPDIHVLTGSLKLFFRELKEPLIPFSVFDRVLSACSIKPREARIKEFRDIVQSLPQCNRDTLKYLLEHLLRVTQYSERNRMHTANLAIVFGPTLLWAPAEQAHNIAIDCIQQNNVVDILLTDFNEIFADDNKIKKKS
ncbi:unnamed protein product [Plutella xylostella]|uniref:(diamondback moth) hypothetical protein n=1 Tax=Plutella xylostella TaxID=51655 RepID=A0A8S4FCG4_PLUXY|nr:unnamed protein product [Plutella xylostella]